MSIQNGRSELNYFQMIRALAVVTVLAVGDFGWLAANNFVLAADSKSVAMEINASDAGVTINMPGINMSANDNGAKIDLKNNPSALSDPAKVPGFSLQMMDNMPMVYMSASASATPANGQQISISNQAMTIQINVGSQVTKILVRSMGDHFELTDTDSSAQAISPAVSTTMSLSVNNQKHAMSAKTSIGESPVSIMPNAALNSVEATKLIGSVDKASLVESKYHRPAYQFDGMRDMEFLGLINVPVKTQVQVDTTDTQAEITYQPWYMNVFGWMFTNA